MSNRGKTKIKDNDREFIKRKMQDKKKALNLRRKREEKNNIKNGKV